MPNIFTMFKQKMILFLYIFAILSFSSGGPLCPSLGAEWSLCDIFDKNTINCLTVSKLHEDPILFSRVVCYTKIFDYISAKLAIQRLLKQTATFVQLKTFNKAAMKHQFCSFCNIYLFAICIYYAVMQHISIT